MTRTILILGSGRMARNIGIFFLKKQHTVTWLSEKSEHLAGLDRFLTREIKRIKRYNPQSSQELSYSLLNYEEATLPTADVIIESTAESSGKKRGAIKVIAPLLENNNTLLFSNSSSILPKDIHPDCIGCHFFYPVELSCLAEVILPESLPERTSTLALHEIENWGLHTILQSEKNAFAVNRLLLPLQTEVFRLLMAGYDPETINTASASKLLPLGQLSLMDAVGLDTIRTSVDNYVARIPLDLAREYAPLKNGLKELLTVGKSGKKIKNGLLCGEPLPWAVKNHSDTDDMHTRLRDIFLHTCRLFIATSQISASDLDLVLSSVFYSDGTLKDFV